MQLTKVGKVTCSYCGSEKPQLPELINQCKNCGGYNQEVKLITIGKSFDGRRTFVQDNRLVEKQ